MATDAQKKREEQLISQMLEYNHSLKYQIQEQAKLKTYKNIMTDYEKKVNQKQINEYL